MKAKTTFIAKGQRFAALHCTATVRMCWVYHAISLGTHPQQAHWIAIGFYGTANALAAGEKA